MTLIGLLVLLVVAGLFLWVLSQFPIDPVIYRIARVVVIVVICIAVLMFLVAWIPSAGLFNGSGPYYRR